MGVLGEVLASLAVAVLRFLLARKDLKDTVRLQIARDTAELQARAMAWMVDAAGRPDGGGDLLVQPGGRPLTFPGAAPDPASPSRGGEMSGRSGQPPVHPPPPG